MAMEPNRSLVVACLDGINAFGEIEQACIRAALEANPSLHMLIPMCCASILMAAQGVVVHGS